MGSMKTAKQESLVRTVRKLAIVLAACLVAAGHTSASERGGNLIRNADFAEPVKRPWSLSPGVVRKETAALSGDWTLSALGKNYHIIGYFDPDLQWEADEAFTLAIDLRSVGSGSTLMLIHRYDKPDGSLGEGWAKRVQPSSDWHEYVIPFRTTKGGRPRGFSFFKIDNGAHDTGIEIRSFKMYRGKVSALDFVPVGRNARAGVLPGSALPVRPSLYGRAAKPLAALVVVNSLKAVREAQHLFAGTGAAAHVLVAEGAGASTFTTDDDPKEIRRRLETGGYDLYAFGRDAARGVGEELFKLVESNVRAGASAYFAFAPAQSGDAGLLAEVMAAKGGRYGKGRVTVDPCRKGIDESWPRRAFIREGPLAGEYAIAAFPYEEAEMARVTDRLWRAAFGAPDLASARQAVEETVYRGHVHAVTRHVDAQGRTLAFACAARPVPGASLGDLADAGRDVEIPVSNCTMTARLNWRFSDFSGRVFGEGTASGPVARLAVPRERLFTSFGLLEVELTDGGAVADRRNYMVVEPENDRSRLIGDYGVGFWSVASDYCHVDSRDMVRALSGLGFRYAFCHTGWGDMLSQGLSATAFYVIGGEYFSGGPTSKDHVRNPVFNTPEARARIRAKALRWAEENRRMGGMYGSFSDEAQLGPNGEEVDAHPENLKVYRRWMERKYGTIAEYNRRHRTGHASFADLGPTWLADARAASNAAEFVEWRTFNVDRWVEVIREVGDAIREVDPKVLYSLDNCFGERALSGADFWKLLTRTGLDYSKEYAGTTSFGTDPFQEFDFLYRSWRPDMRLWGWTGYGFTEERERALPWMTALHRQGGFHWFAATYFGINLLDLVTGAPTLDARECAKSLAATRMTQGLGKTLTDWNWAKNDVAVYYSHDSCLVSFFLGTEKLRDDCHAGSPYWSFQHSRIGANLLLNGLFYQPEWVSSEQAEGGFLDGGDWSVYRAGKVIVGQPPFKALFMPHVLAMTDREVAAVRAFLKRGGKVVCDVLPGAYDELGVPRAAPPFTAQEMVVLGRPFDRKDAAQKREVLALLRAAGATPAIASPTAPDNPDREAVHYREGEADLYAVIRKPLHAQVNEAHDENADELVFAKPGHVYDVRAQRYLGVTDRVSAKVPYAEACLYAVLKEKVEGVEIAGLPRLSAARRGETLSVELAIRSKDVRPRYVLHAALVPPSGKAPYHFRRNLATAGGKASFSFPLALNDETGTWTLRVTEPLTGVTAERAFKVR